MTQSKAPSVSLLKLSLPLILSFWMRSLFTFVDTLYASSLGDSAIAAIGVAIPLDFLLIAIWVGLSTALTSYLSRSVGAQDTVQFDQVVALIRKVIFFVCLIFVLIGAGVYFYSDLMDLDPEVRRGFGIYGSVMLTGSAVAGFWSIIPDSIVKAHHRTHYTMVAGLVSNFTNVILNTIFVFVFHWGLFGIALSTVLGRLTALAYATWRAHQLETGRRTSLGQVVQKLAPLATPLRTLMKLAIPAALAYVLMGTEIAFVNYLLTDLPESTSAIGAYGIFHRVFMFFLMPVIATTVAQLPFISRSAATGDFPLIRKSFYGANAMAAVYTLLLVAPVCYFFSDEIMGFLSKSESLRTYGRIAIQAVPLFCLGAIPYSLSRPIFEGLQKGTPTIIMAVIRYGILALPCGYLGIHLGAPDQSFKGLLFGLLGATILSSMIYGLWARKFILRAENQGPPSTAQLASS